LGAKIAALADWMPRVEISIRIELPKNSIGRPSGGVAKMTMLWDPLENVSNLSQTLVADARRREIRNILKSYVGFFDPFAEAIQNAMDAIDRRQRVLGEPKFQKRLWISVDLQHNTFGVTDNGCGFSEAEFKTFLCPSRVLKKGRILKIRL
jgi:hypothetical protein